MKARYLVNKAKRLENKIHKLQAEIYDFSHELDEMNQTTFSELAFESGFELDVSHQKMQELWEGIENTYCTKITKQTV